MSGILEALWSRNIRVSLDAGGGVGLSGLTALPKDEARFILEMVKEDKAVLVAEISDQRKRHRQWVQDVESVGATWDGQRILFSPFLGIDDDGGRWSASWKLIRGFVPDVPEK